jgi:transcriptional regulator with XRE-family HTH domain
MTPKQFRAARKKLGLSRKQLASLVGGAYDNIARFERDRQNPSSRVPSPKTVELMKAFLEGYRPENWPEGVE